MLVELHHSKTTIFGAQIKPDKRKTCSRAAAESTQLFGRRAKRDPVSLSLHSKTKASLATLIVVTAKISEMIWIHTAKLGIFSNFA